ncbi:MAG TPA: hypothetical protein VFZ46_05610 [Nitrososphaeraceae archaeon]
MISPAMAAMGTNSYDNRYNYDKQPSYKNGYDKGSYFMDSYGDRYNDHKDKKSSYFMDSYGDRYNDHKDKKSSYFMDSYGDRYNDHKDKIKEYECRTGQFEGFLVSSVEFCDAKHKKFHR